MVKASVRGLGRSKVESNDLLGKNNKHAFSKKTCIAALLSTGSTQNHFNELADPWEV